MTGTAILIGEDHTVTVLEDVKQEEIERIAKEENLKDFECKINNKNLRFKSIAEVVFQEDNIDWNYGY